MVSAAILLHNSNMTYLPTNLPVQYYGLPDGKVYIIYGRFYDVRFDKSGIEYVFAVHQEFSYEYEEGKIVPKDLNIRKFLQTNAVLDNPEPKFKIIKTSRKISCFSEAYKILNKKALGILNKKSGYDFKLKKNSKPKFNQQIA